MTRLHSDSGFSQEAFKTQSGSARAFHAVRRSERHGIFRLRCFHVYAGHIGKTALIRGEQRHDRQTQLLFYVYHEFDEGRTSLLNIETFHREGLPVWKPIVYA